MTGELAQAMPAVAKHFWGAPNDRHSNKKELRWGTNGARSVDVSKGTWFDHEAKEGGGVIDLLKREGVTEPRDWLRQHGYVTDDQKFGHQERSVDQTLGQHVNGAGSGTRPRIVATYDYTDETGELLFQVCRFEPKTFRQRRPDGKGGWIWNLEGVARVLYRLPALLEAIALERRVFIVEGEKDVVTLADLGIPATTNAMGAGKWYADLAEHFGGADVIVIPDNDDTGRNHANEVASSLAGKAARIRLLDLPGLRVKDDVSDWFAAGGTVEAFNDLVDQAPDWTDNSSQSSDETSQHNGSVLRGTDYADMSTVSHKEWLVHHLLAVGELSTFYGEPGSGKSVLAEDIALHVAAGRPWFGRAVKQCAVLYVALERAAVVARRALAFGIEHDMVAERLPFRMVRGPLDFRDPTVATQIVATLADLAGRYRCDAGLLIVDTTSRALCGGDENSPKDMGALIANLGRIQGSVEIYLLLTHHQPAEKERMRGHGALLGAVDTTVHITKTTAGRFAEVVKSSDHEEGQRVAFFLNSVTVDTDEQGDPITAPVVIEAMAGVAPKKKASLPNAAKVAINALEEAIAELGVVPPASNHIPPATRAVIADQWRDYAYRRGISTSDKPRAKQAAFERAVKELQAAKAIGIWEPHVWIA